MYMYVYSSPFLLIVLCQPFVIGNKPKLSRIGRILGYYDDPSPIPLPPLFFNHLYFRGRNNFSRVVLHARLCYMLSVIFMLRDPYKYQITKMSSVQSLFP